jgi:F-type H+-transporting ATPase subunit b
MSELIEKLGIDWKLLLAQAANFLVVLIVLRLTLYKPLLKVLADRRAKIEKGLSDAEAAGKRLGEIEIEGKERLADVEREAVKIVAEAEGEAKEREASLLAVAKAKEAEIVQGAERLAEAKRTESEAVVLREAQTLVRAALMKTANLAPSAVDEALIDEAIRTVKNMKKQ